MARYWAKVVNDNSFNGAKDSFSGAKKVIAVVVSEEQELINSVSNEPGTWIETFKDANGEASKRYNFASVGMLWDIEGDFFYRPCDFASWTLDENKIFQPPVAQPEDNFIWNEVDQTWDATWD